MPNETIPPDTDGISGSAPATEIIAPPRTVQVLPLLTEPPFGCKSGCDEREVSRVPYVSPCDTSLTSPRTNLQTGLLSTTKRAAWGLGSAILLGACTTPSHSGPPNGREMGARERPAPSHSMSAPPVALLFAGMDADADHIITLNEAQQGIDSEWLSAPGTNDEHRSAIEMAQWASIALGDANALPNPVAFDSNLDGRITAHEFRARLVETFALIDQDDNGQLTRAELLAASKYTNRIDASRLQQPDRRGPPPRGRQ